MATASFRLFLKSNFKNTSVIEEFLSYDFLWSWFGKLSALAIYIEHCYCNVISFWKNGEIKKGKSDIYFYHNITWRNVRKWSIFFFETSWDKKCEKKKKSNEVEVCSNHPWGRQIEEKEGESNLEAGRKTKIQRDYTGGTPGIREVLCWLTAVRSKWLFMSE